MALKFELKENHIKLLRHLNWDVNDNNKIFTPIENGTPYGGSSLSEDAGLMIFGKPEGEFDPLSPYGAQYSEDQIKEIETLYSELPRALEIIMFLGTFETGHYKSKWNVRDWKKIEK
jgi:hypothetical protein